MFGKIKSFFQKRAFKKYCFNGHELLKAANEGRVLHVTDNIGLHVIYHTDWLKTKRLIKMLEKAAIH